MPAKLPTMSESQRAYLYAIWCGLDDASPTDAQLEALQKHFKSLVTKQQLAAWFTALQKHEDDSKRRVKTLMRTWQNNVVYSVLHPTPIHIRKIQWRSIEHPTSGEQPTPNELAELEAGIVQIYQANHFLAPYEQHTHPVFVLDTNYTSNVPQIQAFYNIILRLRLNERLFQAADYTRRLSADKRQFPLRTTKLYSEHFLNLMTDKTTSSVAPHFDSCESSFTSVLVITNTAGNQGQWPQHDLVEFDAEMKPRPLDMKAGDGAVVLDGVLHAVLPGIRNRITLNTFYYHEESYSLKTALEAAADKRRSPKRNQNKVRRAIMDSHFQQLLKRDRTRIPPHKNDDEAVGTVRKSLRIMGKSSTSKEIIDLTKETLSKEDIERKIKVRSSKRRRNSMIPPLSAGGRRNCRNLGVTCYSNAVVQAIASLNEVALAWATGANPECELYKLLSSIYAPVIGDHIGTVHEACTVWFEKVVSAWFPNREVQQDAAELLNHILRSDTPNTPTLDCLRTGLLTSTMACSIECYCGKVHVATKLAHDILYLHLPLALDLPQNQTVPLQTLVDGLCASTFVTDYVCDLQGGQRGPASLKVNFINPAKILVLVLCRGGGKPGKKRTQTYKRRVEVQTPLHLHIPGQRTDSRWTLVAQVSHHGAYLGVGHYTTTAQTRAGGGFYNLDCNSNDAPQLVPTPPRDGRDLPPSWSTSKDSYIFIYRRDDNMSLLTHANRVVEEQEVEAVEEEVEEAVQDMEDEEEDDAVERYAENFWQVMEEEAEVAVLVEEEAEVAVPVEEQAEIAVPVEEEEEEEEEEEKEDTAAEEAVQEMENADRYAEFWLWMYE